jgi:uncharacterized protein YlxW (UPF0749 family)
VQELHLIIFTLIGALVGFVLAWTLIRSSVTSALQQVRDEMKKEHSFLSAQAAEAKEEVRRYRDKVNQLSVELKQCKKVNGAQRQED